MVNSAGETRFVDIGLPAVMSGFAGRIPTCIVCSSSSYRFAALRVRIVVPKSP
jgi:hypothetical protein